MPLYVADYLADTGHLTTIEHGAYLLLLMHYWRTGALPDDARKLAAICRMSGHQWRATRDTMAALFDEGWKHGRVEIEIASYKRKSEGRAQNGKLGGQAKALKNKETDLAKANGLLELNPIEPLPSSSDVIVREGTSVPSNSEANASVVRPKKLRTQASYSDEFERFWSEYPTDANMSKKQAYAEWAKLPNEDRERAITSCRSFRSYCSMRPDYRPVHANRYLSQGRFEGHAETEIQARKTVFVRIGTPQWQAWETEYRRTRRQSPPVNKEGSGWHFPTEYPPNRSEGRAA